MKWWDFGPRKRHKGRGMEEIEEDEKKYVRVVIIVLRVLEFLRELKWIPKLFLLGLC